MGEIAFENCRISHFQGLVTLTLDRVILHTVMHHSTTSSPAPRNFENTICTCPAYWMIPSAPWRYWRLNDPILQRTLRQQLQRWLTMLLHTKFHWNRRNFLWTDGRTYRRTFETHFITSTRRSRPKKKGSNIGRIYSYI